MFNTLTRMGASAAGDYEIKRSLRFNSADDAYLSRTPSSESNRRTWTWSGWLKRSIMGSVHDLFAAYDGSSAYNIIRIGSNDQLNFQTNSAAIKLTDAKLRDPSAWYHIVVAIDTTSGTAADRVIIYINGVRQTLATDNTVTQNTDYFFNTTNAHTIGAYANGTSYHLDGYMTEINFVDGTALTPSSFGETNADTGAWVPKKYTGAHGTNGFYLNFSDNSNTTSGTLGDDDSSNTNDWTPNNFSVAAGTGDDSVEDTPTNNYCTLNPISHRMLTSPTNGALDVVIPNATTNHHGWGSFEVTSGKWYWECTYVATSHASGKLLFVGIGNHTDNSDVRAVRAGDGELVPNTGTIEAEWTTGDVVMVALDYDNSKWYLGKNGSWFLSGDPVNGTGYVHNNLTSTKPLSPKFYNATANGNQSISVNFGARGFTYTPPTGFKALCTKNLPEPTIKNGTDYFNTVLYTGNDSSDLNSITGVGFQPNLVWGKSRNDTIDHVLFDSVRGDDRQLSSNDDAAEIVRSNPAYRFISDGFQVATAGNLNNPVNYAAWCWKESATAGFDIVSYTGNGSNRTISHSLGVKPSAMVVRHRGAAGNHWVYWQDVEMDGTNFVYWDTDAVEMSHGPIWNSTEPTSSVFSVGTDNQTNQNGIDFIAYLWANVEGYSKAGSYTGNGNADGPFVYCGFRPAYILTKRIETTPNAYWNIFDTARDPYNSGTTANFKRLLAHASSAEATNHANYTPPDILSNGFKLRHGRADTNYDGKKFIFLAFAETPFKYANAR